MRFLFINPARTLKGGNIWSVIKSVTPPIGLASLAALLDEQNIQADIIDAQALHLTSQEIVARACAMGKYDIIGFTATTPEIDSAIQTASLFRQALPQARLLFGGVHPTLFHRELVASGVADFVIRGEGEESIVALALANNLQTVPGLTWRKDTGEVVVNSRAEGLVDLNCLPLPAYHKLPMDRYRSALGAAQREPSIGIITSRGCPGSCTYCYSAMFGKVIRYVSAERVVEHAMLLIQNYGIKEVAFYDDTFTTDRNRVISICNHLKDNRLDLSWSCFARVDSVDQELLFLMRQAGCHQIMYGFESGDDMILETVNKRVSSNSYHEIARMTRAAGIDVRGAFMLGTPGETEHSLLATITLSLELKIQYAIFNITTPYPGTALYAWAEKNDCLLHRNWEDYDYAHPVMSLPSLSPQTVLRLYRRAYRAFYLRPTYILGHLPGMLSIDRLKAGLQAFIGIISLVGKKNG